MSEKAAKAREERVRPFANFQHGRYADWATALGPGFHHPDQAFFDLATAVQEDKRTLLGLDRLYGLWQVARNVATVPGELAEIGVYRGGGSRFLFEAVRHFSGTDVPLHAFDTFDGHPESAIGAEDPFHTPGLFGRKTSVERVRRYLEGLPSIAVHAGDVLATLPTQPERAYRLVHVDTDLYAPTLACLEYFAPRLSVGGVLIVDDYGSRKCEGVVRAVSDFPAAGLQAWDMRTEQLLLVKTR